MLSLGGGILPSPGGLFGRTAGLRIRYDAAQYCICNY